MTAVTVERRQTSHARTARGGAPRPGLGSGRRGRPHLRPRKAPSGYPAPMRATVRACRIPATVGGATATWRLTERGVAVVLVLGSMIMVAALAVVGLTAAQVTGSDYRPAVSLAQSR